MDSGVEVKMMRLGRMEGAVKNESPAEGGSARRNRSYGKATPQRIHIKEKTGRRCARADRKKSHRALGGEN